MAESKIIVLWDLEYVSPDGARERGYTGANDVREVFQLAAVKVDLSTGRELEYFDRLVSLHTFSALTKRIHELTSIQTQEILERGRPMDEVLSEFATFVGDLPAYAYGDDYGVAAEDAKRRGVANPLLRAQFYDIRPHVVAACPNADNYSSGASHNALGIEMPPKHWVHYALDDMRSLARVCAQLYREGKLKLPA